MTEKKAYLIEEGLGGWAGPAARYRLDPPLEGHPEVVIFTTRMFEHVETVITPVSGASISRLPGSVHGFENPDYALFVAGYALAEEPEE